VIGSALKEEDLAAITAGFGEKSDHAEEEVLLNLTL
jgi:hypothetical protein